MAAAPRSRSNRRTSSTAPRVTASDLVSDEIGDIKDLDNNPSERIAISPNRIVNSDEFSISEVADDEERGAPQPTIGVEVSEDDPVKELSVLERREDARGRLAVLFTVATFILFFLGFVMAAVTEGDKVNNLKDIFITISGTFSGLLGFVVGYYFRRGEEK